MRDPHQRLNAERVDTRTAARHPWPWVRLALGQRGLTPEALPAIETRLGVTVADAMPAPDLERLLIEILGVDSPETAPRLPHPSALPLSLAFRANPDRPGSLLPAYPEGFSHELKSRVRRRDNRTCRCCGIREGDLYVNSQWDRYRRESRTLRVLQLRALQIAHPDSQPEVIDESELIALCSRCHQRKDASHNWSAKALTQAMDGRLTRTLLTERLAHLERVTREALSDGTRPLGALQPGGADLLAAHILDQDLMPTARNARGVLPALEAEPTDDIRLVMQAACARLRLRGLLHPSEYRLTRMLTCPQPTYPEQPQYLPRPGDAA